MTDEHTDTLGEMSHANPHTNEAFGDTQTYDRGKLIAADGGEAGAAAPDPDDGVDPDVEAATEPADGTDEEGRTLQDVDHTPPGNAPSASAAYMPGEDNDDG